MAAITPSNTTQRAARTDLAGTGFRVFHFDSVANGDVWVSGKRGVITSAVNNGIKAILVEFDAGAFTFTVASGPATDVDLYVWGPDY